MRIGVVLMPTDPWPDTVSRARHLESLGYHHLWVYDHMTWRRYRDHPWHATYPWLTGVAAATSRIRVGTMVSNPNLRHPVLLAKEAVTIDHISGGRLTIGVGAGGLGFDAELLGDPPRSPAERVDRLVEFAHAFDGVLRGTLHDHRGEYFRFTDAQVLPACVQQPRVPLAIAAGGPRSIRLAAELGDAWITQPAATDETMVSDEGAAVAAEQAALLERRCEQIDRDPATVDRIVMISNAGDRPLANIGAFIDLVGRYEALGFTDLVFHDPRLDDPIWDDDPVIVDEIAGRLLA